MQLRYYSWLFVPTLLLAVLGTPGCQQEVERLTFTGNEFELYGVYVYNEPGRQTENILPLLLPNWAPESARYVVTFEEGGRLMGLYSVADTLVHAAVGAWSQPDAGQVYFRLDRDFDGLYTLDTQPGGELWLRCSNNRSLINPFSTSAVELRLRRR